MKKIIFICGLLTVFACSNSSKTTVSNKSFFDTEVYMNDYFKKHLTQKKIEQITVYNGKEEIIQKDSSELSTLRRLINNSNINKSRLYDKYVVEQSPDQDKYIAQDSSLLVRELAVWKAGSEISKIHILQKFKNINSQSIRDFTIMKDGTITMQKIVDQQDSLFIMWKIR